MPINQLNFFNKLDKNTYSVCLSFANPKELYTLYRQMNPTMKVEAELCLLSQHDATAHEYQLALLLHIAANRDSYANYPGYIKSRYINVLASLLRNTMSLSPNLRVTGLYILSALGSSRYQLPANLHAMIVDNVQDDSCFTNEQLRLVIALTLSNPQQKSALFNKLLPRVPYLKTKVLKQIISYSDPSQRMALFDVFQNHLDTLSLMQSLTSLVLMQLRLLLPYSDAKQQKTLFDKLFVKMINQSPALFHVPLDFFKLLLANINKAQRTALINYYLLTDYVDLTEAFTPYVSDVQLAALLSRLNALLKHETWHQRLFALNSLFTLHLKLPEKVPLPFSTLVTLLSDNDANFRLSVMRKLKQLITHFAPEQIERLFATLITKCNNADIQDNEEGLKFLSDIITHCNEVQKSAFIEVLISKLQHYDFKLSNTAQMIAVNLVKNCSEEQQVVLLDALLHKLNAPQYVQNIPPFLAHEALILIGLRVLIPYYKKHQRLGLLLASIINKLADASPEYFDVATMCLVKMLPHCDEQAELAMILEQLVKTLDKEADYIIPPLVDGLCKLIPKLDAEQRHHLYDALIYKLDLNRPTHAAAIMDVLVALAPYLNASQIDRLYLTGTVLPDTVEDNLWQAIIKAMAKLCLYCKQEQRTSLLTVLINRIPRDNVESEFVADLIKLIPYCNDSQHTRMFNVIMTNSDINGVDKVTALIKLFPASSPEKQADILKCIISRLEWINSLRDYHSGYNEVGQTAHNGLMAMLINFNDQQCSLLLEIFKNKLQNANRTDALVNAFSQIALKFIHAHKKELIEQVITITNEIGFNINLYDYIGLGLVNNLCTQYLFNHAQNSVMCPMLP